MKNIDLSVDVQNSDWEKKALRHLEETGVVVLSNVVKEDIVEKIILDADSVLSVPSIFGSYGYIQKDPFKKMFDGFLFSENVIDVIVHKKVIKLIKSYLNQDVLISECFLKHDLGTSNSYFPYHRHTGTDLDFPKGKKFGCGVMMYLHDTDIGAFCYVPASHKITINKKIYLLEREKSKILSENLSRVVGKKGDIVIFNEAGYHGPEQPVSKSRTVVLSNYQAKEMSGNKMKTDIPVLMSSLGKLDSEQMEALGLGSGYRGRFNSYHMRKRKITLTDKIATGVISFSNRLSRLKNRIKH